MRPPDKTMPEGAGTPIGHLTEKSHGSAIRAESDGSTPIRAIETKYKGYRFRSRLEARWAVFFDSLGVKWEYEPQGFVLPDGTHYLPDFHLTGLDTNGDQMSFWFEIKPDGVPVSYADRWKVVAFAKSVEPEYAGAVFLCEGLPSLSPVADLKNDEKWMLWGKRRRPWWVDPHDPVNFEDWGDMIHKLMLDHYQCGEGSPIEDLMSAITAARSARFEHGESGVAI